MAFEEFWLNVAGYTRVRQRYVHAPDAKVIIREDVESSLENTKGGWFDKRTVQGFRKDDWSFLGESVSTDLDRYVSDFLSVVELRWISPQTYALGLYEKLNSADFLKNSAGDLVRVQSATTNGTPLSQDQIELIMERLVDFALPIMTAIILCLQFDRYRNAEALRLGKEIESRIRGDGWREELGELRFDTGPDSTGDPALWVWVFVAETGEYEEARFLERTDVIEDILEPIAREVAPEGRLYLRFRSTLDQPEVEGVPA